MKYRVGKCTGINFIDSTTLEAICKGFDITMPQFFSDGDLIEVSSELKPLVLCKI